MSGQGEQKESRCEPGKSIMLSSAACCVSSPCAASFVVPENRAREILFRGRLRRDGPALHDQMNADIVSGWAQRRPASLDRRSVRCIVGSFSRTPLARSLPSFTAVPFRPAVEIVAGPALRHAFQTRFSWCRHEVRSELTSIQERTTDGHGSSHARAIRAPAVSLGGPTSVRDRAGPDPSREVQRSPPRNPGAHPCLEQPWAA